MSEPGWNEVKALFESQDKKISIIAEGVADMRPRLVRVEKRVETVEARFDTVEVIVRTLATDVSQLKTDVGQLKSDNAEFLKRLSVVETKVP